MSGKNKILIDNDISISTTMPSKFYLSDNYFKSTIDNIFKHAWQFIAHKDLIKKKLTPFYFLEDIISEPLFIVNQKIKYKLYHR